jgi:Tol biopolymer transport system component
MKRIVTALALIGCGHATVNEEGPAGAAPSSGELRDPRETHLADLKQLTFGGENAEAYWNWAGTELIMQSTREGTPCDQIFRVAADGRGEATRVSSGKGRTTCSFFYPGDRRILYSSTHLAGDACPPEPDRSKGYVWAIYDSYDIFQAKADGSELRRLTETPGYDAEATVCGSSGAVVFTSVRDGDLELYRMDADGSNVKRLTNTPGYDGGAFFSRDCKQLVWRASRPQGKDLEDYRKLLAEGLVRPTKLEIWVGDADGANARQVTYLDAASFAPYFFPDGKRILFSSNVGDPKGREFDLYAVNVDGTQLERITWAEGFDGFPIFSPDGGSLAFSSNRNQKKPGDTDVYVARWVDAPAKSEPNAADRFRAAVAWLADDAREGRGLGTRGLDEAAAWLEQSLGELGLRPMRHAFDVRVGVEVGVATGLTIDGTALAKDAFAPHGVSLPKGEAAGDVVYVEYGIAAPELGRDDYAKRNVKGKIVLARRYAPQDGRFDSPDVQRRYGDVSSKARTAREKGAKALLLADLAEDQPHESPFPRLEVEQFGDAGIPVFMVKRDSARALLKGRHKASLRVELVYGSAPAFNIVARIPAGAPDPLPGNVVIGAHYDHLGHGGRSSMAPANTDVHNGADDNASGTAALLEVARALAGKKAELRRDVWIVAFSAEELGAIGSTMFTRKPPEGLDLKATVAMLNMDMVGRLRKNKLQVLGGESAEEWAQVVDGACARARIDCSLSGSGYGPSDHTAFYAAGVPVLHFFTGAHDDYHKPSDDTGTINAGGGAQVASLVADLGLALAGRSERLTYKKSTAPTPMGDVRTHGASLGTVPDYAGPPDGKQGVLLADVRPGGAADKGGLRRGDIIQKIGSHEVRNVEDLMFVLRASKPGEKARVVLERGGKRVELDVTFGQSQHR